MSISLPNNKEEKRARYDMLVKQGSMSRKQADKAYQQYCRICNDQKVCTMKA